MNPAKKPSVIFMGSDAIACPTLDALRDAATVRLCGVVTQPDRPQKRKLHRQPCAVKHHLETTGIPVWTPERINTPEMVDTLRQAVPDVIVVMAYGQFLGTEILAIPPLGCINVHLSLLPKYRGAAPIQWAIAHGEAKTGVTVMRMVRRMDAGDILKQKEIPIFPADTAASLGRRLAEAAPACLLDVLSGLDKGEITARPQAEGAVSYAPMLHKQDGRIDWSQPAQQIERRIRAFTPWPGSFCIHASAGGRRIRVLSAVVERRPASSGCETVPPGTVLEAEGEGPLIAAGEEALRLLEVQPEGKRPMTGKAYLCGHPVQAGERFA